MSYPTLLVHMGLGQSNAARLSAAGSLAERFDALVIGVAACDPQPPASFEGIYPVDVLQGDRSYAEDQLAAAEKEFRRALGGAEKRIEWRSALEPPAAFVARHSRVADLVISGSAAPGVLGGSAWRLDPGDLVMRAGRPVLLVPEDLPQVEARTIVVGWKDSRESRLAARDALPLARLAERVLVTAVCEDADPTDAQAGLADVVAWMRRHGILAEEVCQTLTSDPASQLRTLALDQGADMIVSGAYGHSRTREWILGGVTHDLLTRRSAQCLLLSH